MDESNNGFITCRDFVVVFLRLISMRLSDAEGQQLVEYFAGPGADRVTFDAFARAYDRTGPPRGRARWGSPALDCRGVEGSQVSQDTHLSGEVRFAPKGVLAPQVRCSRRRGSRRVRRSQNSQRSRSWTWLSGSRWTRARTPSARAFSPSTRTVRGSSRSKSSRSLWRNSASSASPRRRRERSVNSTTSLRQGRTRVSFKMCLTPLNG